MPRRAKPPGVSAAKTWERHDPQTAFPHFLKGPGKTMTATASAMTSRDRLDLQDARLEETRRGIRHKKLRSQLDVVSARLLERAPKREARIADTAHKLADAEEQLRAAKINHNSALAERDADGLLDGDLANRLTAELRKAADPRITAFINGTMTAETAALERFSIRTVSTGVASGHGVRMADVHNGDRINEFVGRCRSARRAAEDLQLQIIPAAEVGERIEALRQSIGDF
jgi:hypothetical protein